MNKTRVNAFCFIILMFAVVALAAPVPDTGQSKCYNASVEITCPSPVQPFYGQDANYTINPMSYTKLDGSGNVLSGSATSWVMVKDNVTGLVWETKTDMDGVKNYSNPHDADNTYTWYDSNPATNGGYAGTSGAGTDTEDFIKALNDARYGGYSDWRMPTSKEMADIAYYGIPSPGPMIDTRYFPNTQKSFYWGTESHLYDSNYKWGMSFNPDGSLYSSGIIYYRSDTPHYVYAVRGKISSVHNSYVDNGNGTVTDTSTMFMWQQITGGNTPTWEQALSYCKNLNLAGYSDWRLPTIKELHSLYDHNLFLPAIDPAYFTTCMPLEKSCFYWSSTTNDIKTNYAWGVSSHDFYDYSYSKLGSSEAVNMDVRAVRGGQPVSLSVLSVTPFNQAVSKDASATTFSVSNTGTGTMPWTAAVTSGGSWISITSGASGSDSGMINCSFTANTSTSARTATIRVTATGATGSPVDVTVTQAFSPTPTPTPVPVLSVTPSNQAVSKDAGTTTFSVSNTGTGIMPWTAAVTSGGSWLSIASGSGGTDSGTITCAFNANTGTSARRGKVRVTAPGAAGSPVDVMVTQTIRLLAASFANSGSWIYNLDSATWTQISTTNSENMIYSDSMLYADFGAYHGLCKWDGEEWIQYTPANPENMVTSGATLYADFGELGIYKWYGDGWSQLTSANSENMVTSDSDSTLYVDFGASYGLYKWDGAAWSQLTSANPENMVTSGATLYADFGGLGIWKWDGSAWSQLTSANPENMATSGLTLYVDFGASYGLYKWDGAAWSQLTSANPENMVTSASTLYVGFGASYGLYKWDGAAWSQLTGSNPVIMAVSN